MKAYLKGYLKITDDPVSSDYAPLSGEAVAPDPSAPVIMGLPVISGVERVGETLTATPAPTTGYPTPDITWQWERAGSPISGATNSTYLLVAADIGETITVVQTAANIVDSDTAESAATGVIGDALTAPVITGLPTITGAELVGEILTATLASVTGNPTPDIAWQWERSGSPISGATNSTYLLVAADIGETITVVQTATNTVDSDTAESAATGVIGDALTAPVITGLPTITGAELVGEILTATLASVTGNPTPDIAWQWERSGSPISGATNSTYLLVAADIGETITVVQTATNTVDSDTAESAATGTIGDVLTAPVITGLPSIAGVELVGEILTATPASVTGNPTPDITWQWERSGSPISGATNSTYLPVAADIGETITVVQTATNTVDSDTAESAATGVIAANPILVSFDVSSVSNGYAGQAVVPVTADDLTNNQIEIIRAANGDVSAWQDGIEIPCHAQILPEDHFGSNPGFIPNYGELIAPAAVYDSDEQITAFVYQGLGHSQWYREYDNMAKRWDAPIFVGHGNFDDLDNNEVDNHGNPAIEKDHNGVWHILGGAHNLPIFHWTSSDRKTWTKQPDIGQSCTYPQLRKIGNDFMMINRERLIEGDLTKRGSFMRVQSKSADLAVRELVTDITQDGPEHPLYPGSWTRDYFVWSEWDGNDLHALLLFHQEGDTLAHVLRNYYFYAVMEFTLDGSGMVDSWRWKTIDGTYLAPANTPVGWNELTRAECWISGIDTDTIPLIKLRFPYVYTNIQVTFTFELDENKRPHMVLSENISADRTTMDVWHITWDGTQWTKQLVFPSGSTNEVKGIGIKVFASDDISLMTVRTYPDLSFANMDYVLLKYDGTTWTETPVPVPSLPYRTANAGDTLGGLILRNPVPVKDAPEGELGIISPIAPLSAAARTPFYSWDNRGNLIKGKMLQLRVAANIPASGQFNIEIRPTASSYTTADAYPGYDRVYAWLDRNVSVAQNEEVCNDFTELLTGATVISYAATAIGNPWNKNKASICPYIVDSKFGNILSFDGNSDPANGFSNPKIDDEFEDGTMLSTRLTDPVYLGDMVRFCTMQKVNPDGGKKFHFARCDGDDRESIWTRLNGNDTIEAGYVENAGPYYGVSAPVNQEKINAAAAVYTDSSLEFIVNGSDYSIAISQRPNYPVTDFDTIGQRRRYNSVDYGSGRIGEVRIASDVTASEWTNGRLAVETYLMAE
jgi:dihydroxyacetone kinase DhaKLM complex PTS-EIIA-like component DhaM